MEGWGAADSAVATDGAAPESTAGTVTWQPKMMKAAYAMLPRVSQGIPGMKGGGKRERINAQFSSMPATACVGVGRMDGWFMTPAFIAEEKGYGHVQSDMFEGDLWFHLQRSPWMRGINFQRKDKVTFEVIEVNRRVEAVKLLLPNQVHEMEEKRFGGEGVDPSMPAPKDFIGQRILGNVKSHHLLVARQNWGFVCSEKFSGQVFWHLAENPDMANVEYDRADLVEFDVCLDETRGNQVRGKNMVFYKKSDKPLFSPPEISERKRLKKQQWLKNWSVTPPPDWDCKFCGWNNFGRNKTCNNRNAPECPGTRPPREAWPTVVQNMPANLIQEDDVQAHHALAMQNVGAEAWDASGPIPPDWQHGLGAPTAAAASTAVAVPQPVAVPQLGDEVAPFGRQPPSANMQAMVALCLGSFNELVANEAQVEGQQAFVKVTGLISETNTVLADDRNAKYSFAMQLAQQPWFATNGLEVRYQPGKNLVTVSQSAQQLQEDQIKRRRIYEHPL